MELPLEKVTIDPEVNEAQAEAERLDQSSERNTSDLEQQAQQPVTEDDVIFSVWSHNERKFIILTASIAAFVSPVSAHIYYPALNRIAEDLKVSGNLINLSITTYMVSAIIKTYSTRYAKVLTPIEKGISRTCPRIRW